MLSWLDVTHVMLDVTPDVTPWGGENRRKTAISRTRRSVDVTPYDAGCDAHVTPDMTGKVLYINALLAKGLGSGPSITL